MYLCGKPILQFIALLSATIIDFLIHIRLILKTLAFNIFKSGQVRKTIIKADSKKTADHL